MTLVLGIQKKSIWRRLWELRQLATGVYAFLSLFMMHYVIWLAKFCYTGYDLRVYVSAPCVVYGWLLFCNFFKELESWAVNYASAVSILNSLTRPVFRNLFSIRGTPWFVKNTWRHATKCRLTKRRYETIHDHKYVSTYKYLPYKNAGIWKQNITHVGKKLSIKYMILPFITITYEYAISYKNSWHIWNVVAAHRLRNTGLDCT
jgi:hypothetical protein